jgi:hypothetical protein
MFQFKIASENSYLISMDILTEYQQDVVCADVIVSIDLVVSEGQI